MNGGWPGGRNPLFCIFSVSLNFSMSSVFFWEFHEICEIRYFCIPRSLLGDWLCNWSSGNEKKIVVLFVLHIY